MSLTTELLTSAFAAREAFFDEPHESAFRLFNGFLEGLPSLSVDLYASSVLIHDYSDAPVAGQNDEIQALIIEKMPWVRCIVVKTRNGSSSSERCGIVSHGERPDRKVKIHGIWYAVDLTLNRDASLYLDTRNLREWAKDNLKGKTVLNTFAYTGSLGVAALAGGAASVVQLDRNRSFLDVAKTSCSLNGLKVDGKDFIDNDFFPAVSQLKRAGRRFDCVFLDPPFFASTEKGRVDLGNGSGRLINKLRPLINDGGCLVSINNALFLSGKDYIDSLEALCADGYLNVERLIPVSEDCAGFPQTRIGSPPVDPAPFNHATKMAILRVRRK